jgi:hypothetical protein
MIDGTRSITIVGFVLATFNDFFMAGFLAYSDQEAMNGAFVYDDLGIALPVFEYFCIIIFFFRFFTCLFSPLLGTVIKNQDVKPNEVSMIYLF